jgi:hypothetical protein
MTFGIYTCCNSRMLPFFLSWRRAVELFNPGIPVGVIPFDDESHELRRITLDSGYHWIDGPAKMWRELGTSVYGASQYRAGVPRANYFSKLAAFNGPFDDFVFADANSLLLCNAAAEFWQEELDACYFWFGSNPTKNYGSAAARAIYRKHDRTFGHGFNACFFAARRGYLTFEMANASLAHSEYHDGLLGPAPEQSMMSWIKVTHGLKFRRVRDLRPNLTAARGTADVRWYRGGVVNSAGHPVHFMKWNGQRFDEGTPNFWLLKALADNKL